VPALERPLVWAATKRPSGQTAGAGPLVLGESICHAADRTLVRGAANSSASGSPSRRREISPATGALSSSTGKPGATACLALEAVAIGRERAEDPGPAAERAGDVGGWNKATR
jgi:hypothetical protein